MATLLLFSRPIGTCMASNLASPLISRLSNKFLHSCLKQHYYLNFREWRHWCWTTPDQLCCVVDQLEAIWSLDRGRFAALNPGPKHQSSALAELTDVDKIRTSGWQTKTRDKMKWPEQLQNGARELQGKSRTSNERTSIFIPSFFYFSQFGGL